MNPLNGASVEFYLIRVEEVKFPPFQRQEKKIHHKHMGFKYDYIMTLVSRHDLSVNCLSEIAYSEPSSAFKWHSLSYYLE